MREIKEKGFGGKALNAYIWDDCPSVQGVLMIVHGMQEHAKRYNEFAEFMNKNGIVVFASDLRAHGKNVHDVKELGQYNGDIFDDVVKDQIIFAKRLKKTYNKPLTVLGHSFGSFVVQRLIQLFTPDKAILVGSAYTKTFDKKLGLRIAKSIIKRHGEDAPAKLIEKMSFKKYGERFFNGNWLTRDEKIFNDYVADPLCGTPFPASFYKSLFSHMLSNYKEIDKISSSLPIYILSGDKDPIGKNGVLVEKLCYEYKKHHKNARMKIYKDCRHEIINETNRTDVYNDILDFILE